MPKQTIELAKTLSHLPEEWPEPLLPRIRAQLAASARTVIVLDDDPTGTQTVHDVPVLTEWSIESLIDELARRPAAVFILTNSRSLPLREAQALNREIGCNLIEAANTTGRDFVVVSRSDSTLRGHYPGEVDALATALGLAYDATLIIPFFLEGGRYTVGNVHYVAEGNMLVPAAETPFAQDEAFGYRHSNLRDWVEEKTGGRILADSVVSITIREIREGGPDRVAAHLSTLAGGQVCVVNAISMRDMEVFICGLLSAEAQGKTFLYRTAASFVQVRAGIEPAPLLGPDDLDLKATGGGLFVVGSYVPKTTSQVDALLQETGIRAVEANVEAFLDAGRRTDEIERLIQAVDGALHSEIDTVLYTSRKLATGGDADQSLAIGRRVSECLVTVVRNLTVRPRYVVAKGGITSSDIATKALDIRRGEVMGQILPGVPVWRTGQESRYPGLAYIVFPGNVGGNDALVKIQNSLHAQQ